MTSIPDWLNPVPFGDVGRGQLPGNPQQLDVMSQDQLRQMREQLLESVLSSVVQAVRGLFFPGPFGAALEQLAEWSSEVLDAQTLLDAINGVYEGDNLVLLAIETIFNPIREFIDWFTDLVDRSGFLDVLKQVVDFFGGIASGVRTNFLAVFQQVVDFFVGIASGDRTNFLTVFKQVTEAFVGLGNGTVIGTFLNVFTQVINFFGTIASGVRANFLTVFQQVTNAFVGLGNGTVIDTFLSVFTQVINFFGTIASGVRANFLTVFQQVTNAFVGLGNSTVIDTFLSVFTQVINFFGTITAGVRTNFLAVFKQVTEAFVGLGDGTVIGTFLGVFTQVINFFGTITAGVRDNFLAVLKQVIDFFVTITAGVRANFLTVFKQVTEAFVGLGNGTVIGTFLSVFTQVINFFGTIVDRSGLLDFFGWLWSQFGATVETLLKPILLFLKSANLQSLDNNILNTIWSRLNDGAEGVGKTLADVLTGIGDFVEGLVPAITGVPGALNIGSIKTWAEDVLTKGLSWIDFKTIFGEIPETILGVLPIANINLVNPELMSQGGFDTTTTLAASTGWAWDGTTTRIPGSSGSAKVTGNGTARPLYSNQSISVAPGDKLYISCWVKSTGTVGAGAITLGVVEFSGSAVAATQSPGSAIASRAGSALFVQIGSTPTVGTAYTVPAGVTSIRVKVAVTAGAATGSTVWFDDISVKKTGLLDGNWMAGVLGTVAQDFQSFIDQLFQGIKGAAAGAGSLIEGAATSIRSALQSIFTTLFGPTKLSLPTNIALDPLLAIAIPGLNASKITTGTFGTGFITNGAITTVKVGGFQITGDKIAGSTIDAGTKLSGAIADAQVPQITTTWNDLYDAFDNSTTPLGTQRTSAQVRARGATVRGSAVAGESKSTALNTALYNSQTPAATILTGAVPGLQASKITSGEFGSAQIAANAITNAKLASDLDATKLTAGTLPIARIADAAITTAKIGDNQITGAKTAGLDATKITGGTIGEGFIPTLPQSKVTGLPRDLLVDATLISQNNAIIELQGQQDSATAQGKSISVNFSTYTDGPFPSTWSVTYSGSGTSTIGVEADSAGWVSGSNADRSAKLIYVGEAGVDDEKTLTDFQKIRGTISAIPSFGPNSTTAGPKFWALGRVSDDGNSYVFARAGFNTSSFGSLRGQLGCVIGGVEQTLWLPDIPLQFSLQMSVVCGVDGNERKYQVYSGDVKVAEYTESGVQSRLCSLNHTNSSQHTTSCVPYRRWGAISETKFQNSALVTSGRVASVVVTDNITPTYKGSLARLSRAAGATGTITTDDNSIGATFFDTNEFESLDIDGDTSTGSFTVTKSKMYIVNARVKLNTYLNANGYLNLQRSTDGVNYTTVQKGASVWGADTGNFAINPSNGFVLTGNWLQYLNAGDKVRLSAQVDRGSRTSAYTGGATETYFAIAGLT